jgi:ubiquinone biosynthesis monooxygenase Coq7
VPGANTAKLAGQIMKVNHAGEQGAVSIYTGQIFMARFTAKSLLPELVAFRADEEKHRAIFQKELARRDLKRCKSYWLCAGGGIVLGVITGLFGARAISITTVAVERVVLRHLREQIALLADDAAAVSAISAILNEEQEHHDKALNHSQTSDVMGQLLGSVVSGATESVIWLGMRL